jgi:hypothetical protein
MARDWRPAWGCIGLHMWRSRSVGKYGPSRTCAEVRQQGEGLSQPAHDDREGLRGAANKKQLTTRVATVGARTLKNFGVEPLSTTFR